MKIRLFNSWELFEKYLPIKNSYTHTWKLRMDSFGTFSVKIIFLIQLNGFRLAVKMIDS